MRFIKKRGSFILLVLGLLGATTLLIWRASCVAEPEYDDVISYLAATAHQAEYEEFAKSPGWRTAGEWQDLWKPGPVGSFSKIKEDLAYYDVHPPLYFWLLHLWTVFFGVSSTAGALLNLPFILLAALGIYFTSRRLNCSRWTSSTVAFLWLMSGSTLSAAIPVRQYSLFALMTVGLMLSLITYLQTYSRASYAAVLTLSLLGILTHYHFGLILVFTGLCCLMILACRHRWYALLSLAAGQVLVVGCFVLIHPNFTQSFQRLQSQLQSYSSDGVPFRVMQSTKTMLQLFLPRGPAWHLSRHLYEGSGWILGGLLLFCLLLAVPKVLRFYRRQGSKGFFSLHSLPVYVAGSSLFTVATLYVLHVSPWHAMEARYWLPYTPVFFIVLGQLIEAGAKWSPPLTATIAAILLTTQTAYGVRSSITHYRDHKRLEQNRSRFSGQGPLIIDTTARGIVPRILWTAPPETPVLAYEGKPPVEFSKPNPVSSPLVYMTVTHRLDVATGLTQLQQAFGLTSSLIIEDSNEWIDVTRLNRGERRFLGLETRVRMH